MGLGFQACLSENSQGGNIYTTSTINDALQFLSCRQFRCVEDPTHDQLYAKQRCGFEYLSRLQHALIGKYS